MPPLQNRFLSALLFSALLAPALDCAEAKPRESHGGSSQAAAFTKAMFITPQNRLTVESPWFFVPEENLEFLMTYNGWDKFSNERVRYRNIVKKGKAMLDSARKHVIASFFLFDNMYGSNEPEYDIVRDLTGLLIRKKHENPDLQIAVILDPLHRSYAKRVSPSIQEFRKHGIDVFYSDLRGTKAATRLGILEGVSAIGSILDKASIGIAGGLRHLLGSKVHIAYDLNGENASLESIIGAGLLKANHRKILVTDVQGGEFEALVTSANPHNASDDSTNTGITVKGDLAAFIYGVLREDLAHSLREQAALPFEAGSEKFAYLSDRTRDEYSLPSTKAEVLGRYMTEAFPPIDFSALQTGDPSLPVKAKFVSEMQVKRDVLRLLRNAHADDVVRIQMFYLSEPEVVQAIQNVAAQTGREKNPVLVLLDPNKDAFNTIKDGTPNRQVAHTLMQNRNTHIKVRWYDTHGEQNHAKIMSITNDKSGKYQITTGSTNWTGKNLNDINMEANLTVEGSRRLNSAFNEIFDRLWSNDHPRLRFTLDYSAYDLATTRKLVLGYEIVGKMSDEEKDRWLQENKEKVFSEFLKDNPEVATQLSDPEVRLWLADKLAKDSSGVTRAMSLVIGGQRVGQLQETASEWNKKYMKKWTNGERWGYVAW